MPAQALYRKWRPQLWNEVIGQDHVVQTLRNALRLERIAHAYLFSGPRGCGKTTSARLVAKALNCLNPDPGQRPDGTCEHCVATAEGRFLDLIEIDGASNNSVEDVRELREKVGFAPSLGRFKVYIIDEVHMLSAGAFNALLKTLEEPPPHAIFILATTELQKIPATILSRCQRFVFRRIPVVEIVGRLKVLCREEHFEAEDAALELVARQATGALRDAISLLDQLAGGGQAITLAAAQQLLGSGGGTQVKQVVEALVGRDLTTGLMAVNAAVDAGADPRQLARQTVDYLRNLMLVRQGNGALVDAPADVREVMARQAKGLEMRALLGAIEAFNAAANDSRGGWQPQLPLELAVVKCTTPPAAAPASGLAATPTEALSETVARPALARAGVARAAPADPAAAVQQRSAPSRPAASAPERRAEAPRPAPSAATPPVVPAQADSRPARAAGLGEEFWAAICRVLSAELVG
jgi:DNA polymerase III subunit gamma/tau